MQKQLLRWWCVLVMLIAFALIPSALAATFTVTPLRVGTFPNQSFYWSVTNLVIGVGDTVTWSNLQNNHSVNPATNSTDPFCGTGTNEIASCTVTFQNPGLFFYDCYQHLPTMTGSVRVVWPPIVSITNPPNNSLYATQVNVTLEASASVVGGTITNVQFLRNNISFATSTVAPYTVTVSNLIAGSHTFRARAVDNIGTATTSGPLTLRFARAPALTLTNTTDGPLRFSYQSSPGVNYVVEGGETVTSISAIVTNAGNGAAQQFSQTNPAPPQKFFRLRLQ